MTMKYRILRTTLASMLIAGGAFAATATGAPGDGAEPYPLEYWALRDVVSNVEVSPDGKRVAMLKIESRDGEPALHIHDTGDLEADPLVIGADPMELQTYGWVSDDDILMVLREKIRDRIVDQNEGVYAYKIALLDVKREKFREFEVPMPQVENVLPNEPNKIIISTQPGMEDNLNLGSAFRPRAYYKLDLRRGTKELLIRGKLDLGQIEFDSEGNPWLARGFDLGDQSYVWYYREPGGKGWEEIYRQHEDSFETFEVFGLDESVPGNLIVGATNGHDTEGLWSYNTRTGKFDELLYQRSDVDITGVRWHSNSWKYPDRIVAVTYYKDRLHAEYFDEVEGATYAQLEELIPHAYYVRITSRSRDGNTLTISNTGPRDPGTYYLYREGRIETLGSQQPLLDSERLADVEYITYESRDGLDIPAFVTIPNGEPPYPLVVMPHGGPFVREYVMYDEWAQMLANNGYMVLQPQYRGSKGYGTEFYQLAWKDGSEAGYGMQDDKDDGALYLVKKGLADPDRVAMFGWSYGGYAALVAASREEQIYQCVIAGAAVADMERQYNEYANEPWWRGAPKIEQLAYRLDAVNPIDEADKVNVPILLIHGSVDQRVQPYHAKLYRNELDDAGKFYKFVELEGADHFYNTLFFEHQITMYTEIIDFLQSPHCFGEQKDAEIQAQASVGGE